MRLENMSEVFRARLSEQRFNELRAAIENVIRLLTLDQRPTLRERLAGLRALRLALPCGVPMLLPAEQNRDDFELASQLYIPLHCGTSRTGEPDSKEGTVESVVESFFANVPYEVDDGVHSLLLLGPSGSGKSRSLRQIERMYWEAFNPDELGLRPQFVPVFSSFKRQRFPKTKTYQFDTWLSGE